MITALLVLLLACAHFFAGNIKPPDNLPRSKWLSFAGGVSVTYVILHLLPELHNSESGISVKEPVRGALPPDSMFLFMLAGFTAFYGLENMARSGKKGRSVNDENKSIFYVHIGSFAVYNFFIGCFIAGKSQEAPILDEVIMTVALGLHFFGNDRSLYDHHKKLYTKVGRWLLGTAVITGFAVNHFYFVQEAWLTLGLATVAGANIFNTIKDELPEPNKASYAFFCLGVAVYAAILYLIKE